MRTPLSAQVLTPEMSLALQGKAHTGRVGGSARYVSIIGLGKKAEANVEPEWGTSAYQVLAVHISTCVWVSLCMHMGQSCLQAVHILQRLFS